MQVECKVTKSLKITGSHRPLALWLLQALPRYPRLACPCTRNRFAGERGGLAFEDHRTIRPSRAERAKEPGRWRRAEAAHRIETTRFARDADLLRQLVAGHVLEHTDESIFVGGMGHDGRLWRGVLLLIICSYRSAWGPSQREIQVRQRSARLRLTPCTPLAAER